MQNCVVFVTAPKGKESYMLARMLLEKKLCACVNIIKEVESFFWWQGKIDTGKESLLVIKTRRGLLGELTRAIKLAHSYEVCEVIALPIIGGSKDYLDWVSASCKKGNRR